MIGSTIIFAGPGPAAVAGTGARKKALVVGISDYTNLQKLDFCRNDGKEVCDVLTSLDYEISDKNKLIGKGRTPPPPKKVGDTSQKQSGTYQNMDNGQG